MSPTCLLSLLSTLLSFVLVLVLVLYKLHLGSAVASDKSIAVDSMWNERLNLVFFGIYLDLALTLDTTTQAGTAMYVVLVVDW